jgi:hypothetical protein
LFRNPRFKNNGKFLTLSEFLTLAKGASSLHGVLINIEVSICHAYVLLVAKKIFKKENPKGLAQVVKALVLKVCSLQGPRFNSSWV